MLARRPWPLLAPLHVQQQRPPPVQLGARVQALEWPLAADPKRAQGEAGASPQPLAGSAPSLSAPRGRGALAGQGQLELDCGVPCCRGQVSSLQQCMRANRRCDARRSIGGRQAAVPARCPHAREGRQQQATRAPNAATLATRCPQRHHLLPLLLARAGAGLSLTLPLKQVQGARPPAARCCTCRGGVGQHVAASRCSWCQQHCNCSLVGPAVSICFRHQRAC